MRTTLLSLAALITGCTVGTTLPFSVHHAVVSGGDEEVAATSGGGDEDAEAAPVPARAHARSHGGDADGGGETGKLACTPDRAGTTFASAAPLGKGVHPGCIATGRASIYAITAPDNAGGTLYDFHLSAPDQICVDFYDKERVKSGGDCISGGQRGEFWVAVAAGSTIYLRLERMSTAVKSAFELEVAEKLLDDSEEPNNSWKQATRLALGTDHQALLQMVLNDKKVAEDFYQVKVGASGELAITIDPNSDDVTAEVAVFNADHQEIVKEHAENAGAVMREHAHVAPGTYYVVVGDWNPQAEAYGFEAAPKTHFVNPYTLNVSMDGAHEKKGPKKQRISKR